MAKLGSYLKWIIVDVISSILRLAQPVDGNLLSLSNWVQKKTIEIERNASI